MSDKDPAPPSGLFGGPGPVLGGQAGGEDYSLASMLGSQTPHDTATTLQTGSRSQPEPERDLGNPMLSAGAQDLLHGAGVLSGSPGGGRPLAHPEDLVPLGKGTGSSDEGISGKEELSSAQETKLGGLSFIRDSNSSRVNSDDSAHGGAEAEATQEAGNPMAAPGRLAAGKPPPDVEGTLPLRDGGGPAAGGGAGTDAQGWSAEGAKTSVGKAEDLSTEETALLHGQGLLSKQAGENPSAVPVQSEADVQQTGRPVPSTDSAATGAGAGERDILVEELTEVPDEVVAEQPSSLDALPEGAHAAWDAAAQVASKAKGLFVGGGRTQE